MIMYRASASKYAEDFSGEGARLFGGRWNSPGIAGLYASQFISLCILEIIVRTDKHYLPVDYKLISLEIPDELISEIHLKKLKAEWASHYQYTQWIGEEFLKSNQSLALKVPSVIVPQEHNFLINPNHPNFKKLKLISIEPLEFDKRFYNV
ncbi:MAG: RES family NAD+ phosphorylase [Ginsengibacter sp.]